VVAAQGEFFVLGKRKADDRSDQRTNRKRKEKGEGRAGCVEKSSDLGGGDHGGDHEKVSKAGDFSSLKWGGSGRPFSKEGSPGGKKSSSAQQLHKKKTPSRSFGRGKREFLTSIGNKSL